MHDRLDDDRIIWLTAVGPSGTPQPNPVWFIRAGDDLVIYNDRHAVRLEWLEQRPQVTVHLNSDRHGDDVVILTGKVEIDEDVPPAHESPEFVAKYGEAMQRVSGSTEAFAQQYSVPTLIRVDRVRGF